MHNISYLCPSIPIFVKNCYCTPSRLFKVGGTEIISREGTTQGDPVSMGIYGIGVTTLISMLIDILSNEYSANVNVMVRWLLSCWKFTRSKNMVECSDRNCSKILLLSRANKDLASS